MTEILLVRHGETDWNAEKRLQGHLDIALNAQGERQAAALAEALSNEPVDAVISSDLRRALHTAGPIADACGLTVQIEPALRERCYGVFEGLLYSEIADRYPAAHAAWRARDMDARYPMGSSMAETLREFSQRAVGAVTRLATAYPNRKIVVVTHGGVLECIHRAATGVSLLMPRDFAVLNASINRIACNAATLNISDWGDIAHLSSLTLDEIDR